MAKPHKRVYTISTVEKKTSETIIVPDDEIYISDYCFKESKAKKIILPDGVQFIGKSAFYMCANLEEIVIPNGIEEIDEYTFAFCKSLKSIVLPDTLEIIRANAFLYCESLEKLEIPSSVKIIEPGAFDGTAITELVLPDSINTSKIAPDSLLDRDKFFGRETQLKSIVLPKKLTEIPFLFFQNCKKLQRVVLPEELITIDEMAFFGLRDLHDISIPAKTKYIEKGAFERSGLENVEFNLSDGNLTINKGAFIECDDLTNIIINYPSVDSLLTFFSHNDFKHLEKILNDMPKNIELFLSTGLKTRYFILNFYLNGPELRQSEKRQIKSSIKGKAFFNVIPPKRDDQQPSAKESEIQSLITQITNLSQYLPEDVVKIIQNKLEELANDYKKNKEKEKEDFEKDITFLDDNLPFGELRLSEGEAKEIYLKSLNYLYMDLYRERNLVGLTNEIKNYKKLLDTVVTTYPDSIDSIENLIKAILYTEHLVDVNYAKLIDNELIAILDKPLKQYKEIFENIVNSKVTLLTTSDLNPSLLLTQNLQDLLDKAKARANKVKRFIILRNALSHGVVVDENNDLVKFINDIHRSISLIKTIEIQDSLSQEFSEIAKKCNDNIDTTLSVDANINDQNYIKVEKDFRTSIIPLLERLNTEALRNDELCNYYKAKNSMAYVLDNTYSDFIGEDRSEEIPCTISSKILYAYLKEICSSLEESPLDEIHKDKLKSELRNIINRWLKEINEFNGSALEFAKLKNKIFSEAASIEIKIHSLNRKLNKKTAY